jgi:hypothetical protein
MKEEQMNWDSKTMLMFIYPTLYLSYVKKVAYIYPKITLKPHNITSGPVHYLLCHERDGKLDYGDK